MLLVWFKALLGAFLMLNFSVPMLAIAKDAALWDESIALLVFNLTLATFVFGSLVLLVGVLDLTHPAGVPLPMCAAVHYTGLGVGLAIKAATLCLAVDQFVAVAHSLHYKDFMSRWTRRLLAFTWSWVPVVALFGFACFQLGLETSEEFDRRTLGALGVQECRYVKAAFIVTTAFEVGSLLMSVSAAVLFVYTAVKGIGVERCVNRQVHSSHRAYFVLRYKSFRRIVKVLLITLTLDIAGTAARLSHRWSPQSTLGQMVHLLRILLLIVEAWTHGVGYPAIRAAIRRLFGCRPERVGVFDVPEVNRLAESRTRSRQGMYPAEVGNRSPEGWLPAISGSRSPEVHRPTGHDNGVLEVISLTEHGQ